MNNPRTETTQQLLTEEQRLIALIDKLAGKRVVIGNRARAQKSLSNVQRELNQRGA